MEETTTKKKVPFAAFWERRKDTKQEDSNESRTTTPDATSEDARRQRRHSLLQQETRARNSAPLPPLPPADDTFYDAQAHLPLPPQNSRSWLEFSPVAPEEVPVAESSSTPTSATTPSSHSPVSPTGLGLSNMQTASSSSNSSIASHTSTRAHRLSKLPPPLPSPTAPLPEPPSARSRSHSLEHLSETRTSSRPSPLPPIQQRKGSLIISSSGSSSDAQPDDSPTLPANFAPRSTLLSPESAQRGDMTPRPAAGRPRGLTVGALPSATLSTSHRASSSTLLPTPSKVRPRSLLSNEIFPGLDLAQSDSRARLYTHHDGVATRSAPDASSLITTTTAASSSTEPPIPTNELSERRPSATTTRSRSGSTASLLQQVNSQPKSHASYVIAVVGHAQSGKSTVIRKGLRKFGLSDPHVLSEKVTSHSTVCIVDQEQRTIEVLEIDASVLLHGPSKRFAWPKFLPHIDAGILCYDAADISSFRGMSELLENFAIADLSTVMLACKSELLPKAVDPYYASDMASVWSVGLAECTTQSDEGKKRMRDCFSYLVREVAMTRSGRTRRGTAVPMSAQRSLSPSTRPPPVLPQRTLSGHSKDASLPNSLRLHDTDDLDSPRGSLSLIRERDLSDLSLSHEQASSDGSMIRSPVDTAFDNTSPMQQQQASRVLNTTRKMSSATTTSVMSEAPSLLSDEDMIARENLVKAQLGLNAARSAGGGYVSIDELWDKVFHAAISRTDERFVTTFLVFYRGFATPQELLAQIIRRFDSLTQPEVAEGLMHRFALIRLANMLADWVQDYPGDLSHPETHAMLLKFHRRLLEHRDTTHTAGHMRAAVEATAYTVDLDAGWSKSVDTAKTEVTPLPLHKLVPNLASISPPSLADEAAGSEMASSAAAETSAGGRSRSVSDVTTSSAEEHGSAASKGSIGARSAIGRPSGGAGSGKFSSNGRTSSHPGHGANASSSSGAPSIAGSAYMESLSSHDQKTQLRNISSMLMEVEDEDIASELTRLEWIFFTAIQPRDLLRHILVPHEQRDGPVAKSISHFNYISNWVCSMILLQGKTKQRARMLEKFYNIAAILRHDNNYGSLNSVLGGLSKTAVHRLKHTRELLKGKPNVNKAYQSLVRLMSNERSSAAYRLALENSEGLTIPYIGVHLQDILSISDGNPSKRASDGMIHWRKFSLMDEAVMAVARCQQYDRYIRPHPAVERLIIDVPVMDDDMLYERSLLVEPRSQAPTNTTTSKIKDFKTFLSSSSNH